MSQQSIEELIRDTLTDPRRRLEPPPGHYQSVGERIGRVRRRRNARWAGGLVAVVALLIVSGVAAARPRPVPTPYLQPTPSSQYGGWHTLPQIGPGEAVQVVADGAFFYLLEDSPGTLLKLDRNFVAVEAAGVPDRAQSLAVYHGGDGIWVLYTRPDGMTMAREYSGSFAPVRDVPVSDRQVFDAVALDRQLWLATEDGLYRIGPSDTVARPVPGFVNSVSALVLDPTRHRLILTAQQTTFAYPSHLLVEALDPATLAVTFGATLLLTKESIAVVADHVWVAGFASGTDQHIYQLDPDKLTVIGTSEVDKQVGPGAVVSAGYYSLWVRDGTDEGLSCVNPATGAIRQQWLVQLFTVASMPGPVAIGVNQPNLVQLALDACPG